jgi:hypothetical protein
MYYYFIKKKQLNCLSCIRDINENFLKGLLEHPVHCDMKFNIYLLYSNRTKNRSKTYSIQIDSLNKQSFHYRSSWIYPIKYPFLSIYRLSVLLKVPIVDAQIDDRCNSSCIHGRCFSYVNDPNSAYCRCDSGWLGIQCNIKLVIVHLIHSVF